MKKSSIELFQKLVFILIIIIIICALAYLFKSYIPIKENLTVCKNEPNGMNCKDCDKNYKDCLNFYIGDSGYTPDYIPYLMQDY